MTSIILMVPLHILYVNSSWYFQGPVVQSIVSLTRALRGKILKQILIYSASMKSYKYQNFDILENSISIIQLNGYVCIHLSGQLQTGLEKNTSFTSPGTMVHVMHVLFVFLVVFENLIA